LTPSTVTLTASPIINVSPTLRVKISMTILLQVRAVPRRMSIVRCTGSVRFEDNQTRMPHQ
jgi:hypothetical protein